MEIAVLRAVLAVFRAAPGAVPGVAAVRMRCRRRKTTMPSSSMTGAVGQERWPPSCCCLASHHAARAPGVEGNHRVVSDGVMTPCYSDDDIAFEYRLADRVISSVGRYIVMMDL